MPLTLSAAHIVLHRLLEMMLYVIEGRRRLSTAAYDVQVAPCTLPL